ncbi:hypothetical protein CHCC14820_4175 [Bacillus paralicheniformis]|nr:hypothetical protein CHCC14820_4175 [Bacillus paralicheniformis]
MLWIILDVVNYEKIMWLFKSVGRRSTVYPRIFSFIPRAE